MSATNATHNTTTQKTYMLVPAMPTPNGRLHLGHIGGPFLAVDILSRHLKMSGHKTVVVSGTDSFDSYVTLQAEKENKTPSEICNYYHNQIQDDFKSMQIGIDKFVNPLSFEWQQAYQKWHHTLLTQLQEAGVTHQVEETINIDDNGNFLTGWRHSGLCPVCNAGVRGYFCEDCGAHFRPEEVVNGTTGKSQQRVTNLFMELPTDSDLNGIGLDKSIQKIYQNYLSLQKGLLRLTASSEWGVPVGEDQIGDKFFNYPFAFAFALMLGQLTGEILGTGENALAQESDVTTICAFGIDNTISVLGSILGITAACTQYKQFDYYLVNHFLDLNGSKFSTSRRHAIWADDIAKLGASSDVIRLFLSGIDIRSGAGNVDSDELVAFYNDALNWINQLVVDGFANLPNGVGIKPDTVIATKFASSIAQQSQFLNPENYQPHNAAMVINQWIQFGSTLDQSTEGYFYWLKGLAILAYPFMPQLGETIWVTLGYTGLPHMSNFETTPELSVKRCLSLNLTPLKLDTFSSSGVRT